MQKIVSVIIPCYNSSAYIESTLNSLKEQTGSGFDLDVICVDDNSDDYEKLKDSVDKYTDDFYSLKLFRNKTNSGGGYSRNVGIDSASGDFVCFLDSDDTWMPNKIEYQIAMYINGSILTSAVYKGFSIDSSVILPKVAKLDSEPVSNALFVDNKLIQTSTFFMSLDIAKAVKFNPSLPRHQDYDFLLRAESLGYSIIQTSDPLSFWRVEDNSSGRFLKKKASPEFFIDWYKDYSRYMTSEAQLSYVAKNIFSACMITKKFSLFFGFLFSDSFTFSSRIKVLTNIVKWRVSKLFI